MPEEPREYGEDARQDDARQLAKWAERYARSRTIPFLVQWVFIVLLVIVLAVVSYIYRSYLPMNQKSQYSINNLRLNLLHFVQMIAVVVLEALLISDRSYSVACFGLGCKIPYIADLSYYQDQPQHVITDLPFQYLFAVHWRYTVAESVALSDS